MLTDKELGAYKWDAPLTENKIDVTDFYKKYQVQTRKVARNP